MLSKLCDNTKFGKNKKANISKKVIWKVCLMLHNKSFLHIKNQIELKINLLISNDQIIPINFII